MRRKVVEAMILTSTSRGCASARLGGRVGEVVVEDVAETASLRPIQARPESGDGLSRRCRAKH